MWLVLTKLIPASHNKYMDVFSFTLGAFFYFSIPMTEDLWLCVFFALWFCSSVSLADLSPLIFCLQVSDDDSYISDVSDSVSMDTYSNEGGSERHNSGKWYSNKLCVCAYCVCEETLTPSMGGNDRDSAKCLFCLKEAWPVYLGALASHCVLLC